MIERRRFLGIAAGVGAAGLAITPELLRALKQSGGTLAPQHGGLIRRAVPSTGEMLPVIGLTFANHAGCADPVALREVLAAAGLALPAYWLWRRRQGRAAEP